MRDPLQRAEDSKDSDDESGCRQQKVHTGTFPSQESEQPHASDPTSSTGFSPTFSVTFNEPVDLAIDMDSTATAIEDMRHPAHLRSQGSTVNEV